jgi:hypothetical protein
LLTAAVIELHGIVSPPQLAEAEPVVATKIMSAVATQVPTSSSHTADAQSVSVRHAVHLPATQKGRAPSRATHSLPVPHARHTYPVMSQIGVVSGQLVDAVHIGASIAASAGGAASIAHPRLARRPPSRHRPRCRIRPRWG